MTLELCRTRFQLEGLQAHFVEGDIEHLDSLLPQGAKYDLVWCFGVVHHTPNPTMAIEQIKRFLAPDVRSRGLFS